MDNSKTYSNSEGLIGVTLTIGDYVNIGSMTYKVTSNHLSNLHGMNSEIFKTLGMNEREKERICDKIYGYRNLGGDFPSTESSDMQALTSIAYYLMKEFETVKESLEKEKSALQRKTNLHRLIEKGEVKRGDMFVIAGVDIEVLDEYLRIGGHMAGDVEKFMSTLAITRDDINRAYDHRFVREMSTHTLWPEFPDIFGDTGYGEHNEAAYRCLLFLLMREELLFGPQYDEEAEEEERRLEEEKRSAIIQETREFIDDATYVIDKISEDSARLGEEISRLANRKKLLMKESYALRKERRGAVQELEESDR